MLSGIASTLYFHKPVVNTIFKKMWYGQTTVSILYVKLKLSKSLLWSSQSVTKSINKLISLHYEQLISIRTKVFDKSI